jgi:serine/threonine protein kinase
MMQSFWDLPTHEVQPQAGLRIAEYSLVRKIGGGEISEVWLGVNAARACAAIKIMSRRLDERMPDHKYGFRFLQEGYTMLGLRHPCILRVFQVSCEERWFWIVSEYMACGTVADILDRRGRVPLTEASIIINNVLHALEYAHGRGIIHRDIKPANMLVDNKRQHVVLADFGIMQSTTSGSRLTLHGKMVGTPEYVSPEQARGKLVDPRSDLYSVGAVFYHLLFGRPPFEGTGLEVARHHVRTPLTFPDELMVRDDVRAFIEKAMAKEPESRFASAREMRHALNAILERKES